MYYVALLRGINVGGKNKIDMAELRQVFERAGMRDVRTYINSGNVIFNSDKTPNTTLAAALERAIAARFALTVPVTVRSRAELLAAAAALPAGWVNDGTMKCDVLFLWPDIDRADIVEQLVIKPDIDQLRYVPGALLWAVEKPHLTRSGLLKVAGSELYQQMTVRNCNTVRKLAALLAR